MRMNHSGATSQMKKLTTCPVIDSPNERSSTSLTTTTSYSIDLPVALSGKNCASSITQAKSEVFNSSCKNNCFKCEREEGEEKLRRQRQQQQQHHHHHHHQQQPLSQQQSQSPVPRVHEEVTLDPSPSSVSLVVSINGTCLSTHKEPLDADVDDSDENENDENNHHPEGSVCNCYLDSTSSSMQSVTLLSSESKNKNSNATSTSGAQQVLGHPEQQQLHAISSGGNKPIQMSTGSERSIQHSPGDPATGGDRQSSLSANSYRSEFKKSVLIAGNTLRTIVEGLVNRRDSIATPSSLNVSAPSPFNRLEDDSLPLTSPTRNSSSRLDCQVTRNRIDREYKFDERSQTWYCESNTTNSKRIAGHRKRHSSNWQQQNQLHQQQQIKSTNKVDSCDSGNGGRKDGNKQAHYTTHSPIWPGSDVTIPEATATTATTTTRSTKTTTTTTTASTSTVATTKPSKTKKTVKTSPTGKGVTFPTFLQLGQSYSVDDIDRLIEASPSKRKSQVTEASASVVTYGTSSSRDGVKKQLFSKIKLRPRADNRKQIDTSVLNETVSIVQSTYNVTSRGNKVSKQIASSYSKEKGNDLKKDSFNSTRGGREQLTYINNDSTLLAPSSSSSTNKRRCTLKKCNSNFEMGAFFYSDKKDGISSAHSTCAILPMEWGSARRKSTDLAAKKYVTASERSFPIEEEAEEDREEGEEVEDFDVEVYVDVEEEAQAYGGEGDEDEREDGEIFVQSTSQWSSNSHRIPDSCCDGAKVAAIVKADSAAKLPYEKRGAKSEFIVDGSSDVSSVTSELTHRCSGSVSKKLVPLPRKATCPSRLAIHEETEGCDQEPHHQMLRSRLSYPDDGFTSLKPTKNPSNICSNDSFILARRHSTSNGTTATTGTSDSSSRNDCCHCCLCDDNSHQEEAIDYSQSHPSLARTPQQLTTSSITSRVTSISPSDPQAHDSLLIPEKEEQLKNFTISQDQRQKTTSSKCNSRSSNSKVTSILRSFTSSSLSSSGSRNELTTKSLVNGTIAKFTKQLNKKKHPNMEGTKDKQHPRHSSLVSRSMSRSTISSSTSTCSSSSSSSSSSSTGQSNSSMKFCNLCLDTLPLDEFHCISSCGCSFCKLCLTSYLTTLIRENNVYVPFITCPDADCPKGPKSGVKGAKGDSKMPSSSLIPSLSFEGKGMRYNSSLKQSLSFLQSKARGHSTATGVSVDGQRNNSPEGNYSSLRQFKANNLISPQEICLLVDESTYKLYGKLKIEFEVRHDPSKTFCPMPNCDNICNVIRPTATTKSTTKTAAAAATTTTTAAQEPSIGNLKPSSTLVSLTSPAAATAVTSIYKSEKRSSYSTCKSTSEQQLSSNNSNNNNISNNNNAFAVYCDKCNVNFCFKCRSSYHPGTLCPSQSDDELAEFLLAAANEKDGPEIKRCPRCSVWIERDDGCAQMMCRKCRHVFCWFCLTSLEDDFLLRHYDSGPCKNKLGHSRASVMWHRTQVVGIFAGFGVLLLLAAPLFLLAFPCVLCCSCCSKTAGKSCCKWLQEEDEFDEDEDQTGDNESLAAFFSQDGAFLSDSSSSSARRDLLHLT